MFWVISSVNTFWKFFFARSCVNAPDTESELIHLCFTNSRPNIFAVPLPASNRKYRLDLMSIVPPMGRKNVSIMVRINFMSMGESALATELRRSSPTSEILFVPTNILFFALRGQYSLMILLPELIDRLFPATMSIFFPSMRTFPLGALMVMPVKALMLTLPSGESMEIVRLLDDMEME